MDHNRLEKIAEDLSRGMKIGRFPDDYVDSPLEGKSIGIPAGEAMMFRKDEFIQVMVRTQRFNFMDHYVAKFFYYCAKTGTTSAVLPGGETLRTVIRRFEDRLDRIKMESSMEINALHLDRYSRDELERLLLEKIGVYDLI